MKKKTRQPNLELRENIGKLLLDLAKLIFASFILGGILRGTLLQYIIIGVGAIGFVAFVVIGLAFISSKEDRR